MKKIMIVIAIILSIAIMISMVMSLPKINNQFESCVSGYYVSSIDFEDSEIQCRLDETFNQSLGNDTYLLLDASNGPLTGDLQISANVGIGTDNLTVPLEINSKGNGSVIINTDSNSNFTYLYLTEGLHQAYTGYTKYGIYLKYNGDTNNFAIGNVQADVETDNFYIDRVTGNVGFGTATVPKKILHSSWVSTDTNVVTGNALGGGGVGKGALIQNTAGTINSYANLDFRTGSADGRIGYQIKGTNKSDFHFITDNNGPTLDAMNLTYDGNLFVKRDIDSDGNFTGNQIYGGAWYHNHTATPISFAVAGKYYNLFLTNATDLNGFRFQGGFNKTSNLTAQVSGKYQIIYSSIGDGQNNHEYTTTIMLNGSMNTIKNECDSHKKMSAGGDITTMNGNCIISISVNDIISLVVANEVDTGTGNYYGSNINLVRLGDL